MAYEPFKLAVGPLCRPLLRGLGVPHNAGPARDFLGEDFADLWEYYYRVGLVPPRQLPTSSYKVSNLIIDGGEEYLPSSMNKQAVYNGLRKASVVPVAFSDSMAIQLRAMMEALWGHNYGTTNPVTFDFAVRTLDLSTSPGFPEYYHNNTKRRVYDPDLIVGALGHSKNVSGKQRLLTSIKNYLAGELNVVWTATLKDELVTKEKAQTSMTRLFQNGPYWFLILMKMVFHEQMQIDLDTLGTHPDTVGIQVPGPALPSLLIDFREARNKLLDSGNKYVYMFDSDRKSWDYSIQPSGVGAERDMRLMHLPKILNLDFDGDIVVVDTQKLVNRIYSDIYYGFVAVGGNLIVWYGQKSGQLLTANTNSKVQTLCDYPALLPYLGSDPIAQFLQFCKKASNGDDGLTLLCLKKAITIYEYGDACQKCGTYFTTASGFTDDVYDMVYLSHQMFPYYISKFKATIQVMRARLEKLKSALRYYKSRDDAINMARYYAVVSNMFGYEEFEHYLQVVDNWVSTHPRNKHGGDLAWRIGKFTRPTMEKLASQWTGLTF